MPSYGLNPFGITVTGSFYSEGSTVHAEITANLTDAFDTFGACKKKVSQISDRIRSVANAGAQVAVTPPTAIPVAKQVVGTTPPVYTQRAGPSLKGKATTGFWLSVGGFFFMPAAIGGIIMCGMALNGMSTSTNKDGQGLAQIGAVVGVVAILVSLALAKYLLLGD